jgi:uncharacterized membrane protein
MLVLIVLAISFVVIVNLRNRLSGLEWRLRQLEEAQSERLDQSFNQNLASPASVPPVDKVRARPTPKVDVLERVSAPVPTQALRGPVARVIKSAPVSVPEPMAPPTVETETDAPPAPALPMPEETEAKISPQRSFSINFEDLFGRRLPIWAGGITLAIAGILIVKYGIAAGFFTPWIQAATGFLFGTGLIAGAEFASRNEDRVRDPRVRQALSGASLATLYATILMASNGYGLIGPLAAFIGMALVTAGALALSIRFGPPSALLGLAGGLATPALVGSLQPDVPMLSVYLALTIGGLTAVSRMQRWAWLGISALVGGAGWSLWLIGSGALDLMSSLSVGGLVLLMAMGLPMLAFAGPRAAFMRSATAIVGSAQLAMLVAVGGYTPLNWGLFALIAVAGQWLSWREKGFEIVPSISLGLSAILLVLWPDPAPGWYIIIGGAMALIHAVPLLLRVWQVPARFTVSMELTALSLAILLVPLPHFIALDGSRDTVFALLAAIGALTAAIGAGLGWSREDRIADARFALLVGTASVLTACAVTLLVSTWFAPLGIAFVAASLLFLSERAGDRRLDIIATVFACATLPFLLVTDLSVGAELSRLYGWAGTGVDAHAMFRWGGVCALFALFAARSPLNGVRYLAHGATAAMLYGAIAQFVPGWALPLDLTGVLAVLMLIGGRRANDEIEIMAAVMALAVPLLLLGTGSHPLNEWARLAGVDQAPVTLISVLRWAAVAALALYFAARSRHTPIRTLAQIAATCLGYGAIAQMIPGSILPMVPAAALALLSLLIRRHDFARFMPAAIVMLALVGGWAIAPVVAWLIEALRSLIGLPMVITVALPVLLKHLLVPGALVLFALWNARKNLPRVAQLVAASATAMLGVVSVHSLYRLGFAHLIGSDFVETGMAERMIWGGLLMTGGWVMGRGATRGSIRFRASISIIAAATLHGLFYTLLLHNPLWATQSVGAIPVLNLLIPAFGFVPIGMWLMTRMEPEYATRAAPVIEVAKMALATVFAFATLRQAFVGPLLVVPGVGDTENILRSIVAIALAIGFLLWGIRSKQRNWRIASLVLMIAAVAKVFLRDASGLEGLMRIGSFVALGFSLIGIGWLYSRQLGAEAATVSTD